MRNPTSRLRALVLALVAAACGGRTSSPFPPGINELQDQIDVAWPTCPSADGTDPGCASPDDPYPQTLATEISGTGSGYGWAHGRGYLKYPIAQVWAALQLPDVVNLSFYPERGNSKCGGGLNVEPGYDVSFETHETPNGWPESLYDFAVTFREGIMEGDVANPQEIGVVYQKTWGATNPGVQTLAGSIIFKPASSTDPNVTTIEMIRHLSATNTKGGPQAQSWITDYYNELVSVLGGTPPPALCSGLP
ncbi:MAG TPA: hypothetical protein VMT17_15540 [Anaeromyxobacteraceae bacterium]|nr:hypothetical protein [Anaeromyxobacteraceae bacterium]